MKSKYWIIIVLSLLIIGVIAYFIITNNAENNNKNSNYSANRTEATIDENNLTNNSNENSVNDEKQQDEDNVQNETVARHNTEPIETEISTFSTPIMTQDANRQNNVELTCSSLNDTVVENGQTFSFCDTLGPATTSEGYKKAEVFDAERK